MVRPDKPRRHCERSGALAARLARKRAVLVCASKTAEPDDIHRRIAASFRVSKSELSLKSRGRPLARPPSVCFFCPFPNPHSPPSPPPFPLAFAPRAATGRFDISPRPPATSAFAHYCRLESTDIVEKLEFPRRSQLRRPLAASMEISLGAQRCDRFFCVRPSLSPCCGKHPWRQRFPRGSGIFAAPQFPTFSTISTYCGP